METHCYALIMQILDSAFSFDGSALTNRTVCYLTWGEAYFTTDYVDLAKINELLYSEESHVQCWVVIDYIYKENPYIQLLFYLSLFKMQLRTWN